MNMMEKIKIPQVEINLSDWQGAGISERETKKRAMEVLKVDQKGWKKAKEEDKIAAKDIVYQNTDKEKPVEFLLDENNRPEKKYAGIYALIH